MRRSWLVVAGLLGVLGCADERLSPPGTDGAAIGVCRGALSEVADPDRLATTVRAEGDGYVVRAWRDGTADGTPDHVCVVARDGRAERGVRVVEIRPSP